MRFEANGPHDDVGGPHDDVGKADIMGTRRACGGGMELRTK